MSRDKVCLMGNLCTNQTFGEIQSESYGVQSSPFDGLLGLAFRSLADNNVNPLLF